MLKRTVLLGLVASMPLGLGGAASAAVDTQWTILMRAGELDGYDGVGAPQADPVWLNSFSLATLRISDSASRIASLGFLPSQAGIHHGTADNPYERIVVDKKAYDPSTCRYWWDLTLETGADWISRPITIGWWVPVGVENFSGWHLEASRNAEYFATLTPPTVFQGAGNSGSLQVLAYLTDIQPGTTEHWRIYATVPEPGSMLAMLSGLAGLGFLTIRRRRR